MKKHISWLVLMGLLITGCLLSLTLGTLNLSLEDLFRVLVGQGTTAQNLVVVDFRLPRMLISILAGMGLALSGYLFQAITHNDLADPGILGINAGAGFTVLVYLGFFANNQASWMLPLIACLGSIGAAFLVYYCGRQAEKIVPNRLLLSGVAVNAGISALTLIGTIRASSESYTFVTSWLAGTIWGTTWQHVFLLIPWLVTLFPVILIRGRTLRVMSLGDETAIGLGVRLKASQLFFLLCALCLAAVSVSVAGSISFIGLIAPHIANSIVEKKNTVSLVMTGIIGSLLLLYSDIAGRLILDSGEIAAGIVVSVVGTPYFVYQLLKTKH
ncbi:FecCD family ABC transporter permease [Candidatus Enterococcus ferrettii]|uniref:Iron complex transport system permease n=1 Tax=Candidatus Enterococcus ferrettii TaxID=2815324 RepID=A0ABV0EW08_9ENTE|nr:iron ABC transporter permease [Enterococcus sp. 665A]MBO1339939.1 iron ABC transporter permease [Enterococcus sp. 665A]